MIALDMCCNETFDNKDEYVECKRVLKSAHVWFGGANWELWEYLRPVSGCTSGAWETAAAAAAAAAEDGEGCLGLLTLVLLLANSNLMVWGKSGSKRTPCCKEFRHESYQTEIAKKSSEAFFYTLVIMNPIQSWIINY